MPPFRLGLNRRALLALSAAAFAVAPAFAAPKGDEGPAKIPLDQLLVEQALPDLWLGDAKAPITIVEYASMTCSHCAHFTTETLPKLKTDYIDKGKARYVLREFPLDPLAAAAAMLARCSGEKREAVVELLFQTQKTWAYGKTPLEDLTATLKQTGMGQSAFEACLNDEALFKKMDAVRAQGAKFGITATPTFFINGEKHSGDIPPGELDALLAPHIK